LMNTACSKAFGATGIEEFRQLAIRNMDWMLSVFFGDAETVFHSYKQGKARIPAFLDDYTYLVQALIYMQEITGLQTYLERAKALTAQIIDRFGEEGNQLFYYTFSQQTDVVIRKREVYDGAQPSGNAVMVLNLHYLGLVFDLPEWQLHARKMLESMGKAIMNYPVSFGCWAMALFRTIRPTTEIVVVGADADALRNEILANFIPFTVLQSATRENKTYPLLRNKPAVPETLIYVCQNYTCNEPVSTVGEMLTRL
jgi:uncharacterized protein